MEPLAPEIHLPLGKRRDAGQPLETVIPIGFISRFSLSSCSVGKIERSKPRVVRTS